MASMSRSGRKQQGLATVEFAIVGAVLIFVVIAIMELGLVMYARNHVTNIAREAARYAALHGSESPTPATAESIESYVLTHSNGLVDTDALTVTITWLPDNTPGSAVRVQVEYPVSLAIPFLPEDVLTLQSASEMVIL